MKKEMKQIIAGLCLLLVAVMAVFYGLYRMMDRQTERDVREIGRVFLEEKARQEKLKEDLRQQKEDLRDGSSSSSYDYEYIDGGDAQGYGEGTLW